MAYRLECVGIRVVEEFRECLFKVTEPDEDSEIFTVANTLESFSKGLVRYQDGPQIGCTKLKRALAEETGTLPYCQLATISDLEETREAQVPQKRKGLD